jgi:hypothetical protein
LPIDEPYSKFKTETKIYNFERVHLLKYLAVTVSCDNEEELDMEKRMSKGSKEMDSLNTILKSKKISRTAKVRI